MPSYKIISFALAQVPEIKRGEAVEVKPDQSVPQYYDSSIPKQFVISVEKKRVNNHDAIVSIKAYHPDILLVEAEAAVKDVFADEAFTLRELLIDECENIVKAWGGKIDLSEEYSLAVVSDYEGDPEQFLKKGSRIASFLKSEKMALDDEEIVHTLSKQIKYSKDDLVIVDWDGAFIFEPSGKIDYTVDIFQAANLQLVRYRNLDADLDHKIKKVSEMVHVPKRGFLGFTHTDMSNPYESVIKFRAKSISEFEALEREIKLIGDWYSARLYEMIAKKFRIPDWRQAVKDKLESLEDIYSIISNNFSVSKMARFEWIQTWLWFFLQIGWLILIFFEFKDVLH